MNDDILYEISDDNRIFTIILNRPNNRNAIDRYASELLADIFKKYDESDCDICVLTSSSEHFCAGADLKRMNNSLNMDMNLHSPMGPCRMMFKKPVIAAISGYCVAGGLELSLMCDIRIADSSAKFGVFCRRFGVPLIDGGTVRLPRIIGFGRALDMILTGRCVDANEAIQIGLITKIVANGQVRMAAEEIARQIISFPKQCMLADRYSTYKSIDLSFNEAMKYEFHNAINSNIINKESLNGALSFTHGYGRNGKQGTIRTIFFDLGGVVINSPIKIIEEYGKKLKFPQLNRMFAHSNAWEQLETGQITLQQFCKMFDEEAYDKYKKNLYTIELFKKINNYTKPRAGMVGLIHLLRKHGYLVGAITNNWIDEENDGIADMLTNTFDCVVESCKLGIRKPNSKIFTYACEQLNTKASECVFLDDIGKNLKAAKELGMYTIKVHLSDENGENAIEKLCKLLNLQFTFQQCESVGKELIHITSKL